MKTIRKKIVSELDEVVVATGMCSLDVTTARSSFITAEVLTELNKPEITIEIEVPETIKEFRTMHNLTKEQLVDWLTENYTGCK